MTEIEFQDQCQSHGIDVRLAVTVRKALAEAIKADPHDLSFGMLTSEIIRRADHAHRDGWDDMYFLFAFEEMTGLAVPDDFDLPRIAPGRFFFWKWPGAETFGEWCQKVVPALKSATTKREATEDVRK